MKRLFLLLGLLLPLGLADADIYKWTDENGRVYFSDTPRAAGNSKPVELGRINTYDAPSKIFIDKTLARPTGVPGANGKRARVTVYSTTWCGVCVKAKNWLKVNGIRFQEYDVEQSNKGKRDYQKLNGRGVPIILVGQQRMNGFSPSRMRQMLENGGYRP
jgi:glutaredoxin